jgi:hypothetical protein
MLDKKTKKLVFMDFEAGVVYELKVRDSSVLLDELDTSSSTDCFEDMQKQQEALNVELPIEQIVKIMSAEKELADKSTSHIFRREL